MVDSQLVTAPQSKATESMTLLCLVIESLLYSLHEKTRTHGAGF